MIELQELSGDNIHNINKAEKIRQRAVFKFDNPRFEIYLKAITKASDWLAMPDFRGDISEEKLKKTYEKVKKNQKESSLD